MTEKNTTNNIQKVVIFIAVAIAIAALYFFIAIPSSKKTTIKQLENDTIADIGGDFELTDQNGQKFNSTSLHGKLSLIYFGFTYCPDICPTSLQKITEAMETLDKYHIDVTPVFITIDPQRDTSELLKNYLSHFHHKFIGLTGSDTEIKKVADQFKVYYAIASSTNQNKDDKYYMLDHTSFIYLMDKNGKYIKHFYITSKPEEIVEFIRINK